MKWTEKEIEFLKENYKTMNSTEIGLALNRTEVAVQIKARKLGIKKNNLSKTNEDYFSVIDNPNKAYWLGFIYADGFVVYDKNRRNYEIGIELNSIDINHLHKFNSVFDNEHKILTRLKTNEMCRIRIYSKKMCEDLINLNVKPNKTYLSEYPTVNDDLFYHLLRGFIDGDGSYSTYKIKTTKRIIEYPRITIVNNNLEFLKYIKYRVELDGIKCGIYKDGDCWKFSTYGEDSYYALVDKLFENANLFLDRKFNKININTHDSRLQGM